jgi:hypothetical protein
LSFNEGRGKREEGRGKREEGRRKIFSHLPLSPSPTLSPTLPLSSYFFLLLSPLPVKWFNYLCLATKSSKKLMRNQEKSVILVF